MRITLLLVLGLSLPSSQDPRHDAAMLRQAQQLAVPVAQHQRLQRLTGEWKVASQAMGTTSEGAVAGKAMLGGRYVVLSYRLPRAGRELEAVQLLGFDTLHQVYTSSWRDDASTWAVEASGTRTPRCRTGSCCAAALVMRATRADGPTGSSSTSALRMPSRW